MSGQTMKSHGASRFKRVAGRLGAGAFLAASLTAGTVALTGQLASADSAFPTSATGSVVVNGDGTITLTVSGTWQWVRGTPCNENRWGTGWAIDWNDADQTGFPIGEVDSVVIDVGVDGDNALNTSDNAVHYGSPCDATNTGTWGPSSHTYAAGTKVFAPCAVTYDLHGDSEADDPESDGVKLIAGDPAGVVGKNHNEDNSVEDSSEEGGVASCDAIDITPHLTLNKVVINNDTAVGSATGADFTLAATHGDDEPSLSGVSGVNGDVEVATAYDLSETGDAATLAAYDASDWVCDGGVLDGSSLTLGAGEIVTCTITNDDNGDQQQAPPIPTAGSNTDSTVLIAGLGVLLGFAMTMFARRRRTA